MKQSIMAIFVIITLAVALCMRNFLLQTDSVEEKLKTPAQTNEFRNLLQSLDASLPTGELSLEQRAELRNGLDARERAIKVLQMQGTNVLPKLAAELQGLSELDRVNPDAARRTSVGIQAAFDALGHTVEPLLPVFTRELCAQQNIGPSIAGLNAAGSTEAGLVLVSVLTKQNAEIRLRALGALPSFATNQVVAEAAVAPLLNLLNSGSQPVRALSARMLGKLRQNPTIVLPALMDAAKNDQDIVVRRIAIAGISDFGRSADLVTNELANLARGQTDSRVAAKAVAALETISKAVATNETPPRATSPLGVDRP